jgi:hypothetical protein
VWGQALDIPSNQEITGLLFKQVVQGILAFLDLVDETLTLPRVIAAEWGKKKPGPKIDEEVLKEIQVWNTK